MPEPVTKGQPPSVVRPNIALWIAAHLLSSWTTRQPHLPINRPHHRPYLWTLHREPYRSGNATRAGHDHRMRRANSMSERASQQTAERCRPEESHRVITHHARAFVFRHQ